jgi:hypothetical protein
LLTAVPFPTSSVRLGGCPTPTTWQVTGGGPPHSKFYEDRDILLGGRMEVIADFGRNAPS